MKVTKRLLDGTDPSSYRTAFKIDEAALVSAVLEEIQSNLEKTQLYEGVV